jgi:hypothetical protein
MDRRIGYHHLRIEQGMTRELPVEGPTMSVRPIDHWCDSKSVAHVVFVYIDLVSHYGNVRLCARAYNVPGAAFQHLMVLIERKAAIVQPASYLCASVKTTAFSGLVVKSQQRFQNPQFDSA